MRIIRMVLLLLALPVVVSARAQPPATQEPNEGPPGKMDRFTNAVDLAVKQSREPVAEVGQTMLPAGVNLRDLDDSTKKKYLESVQECFQYRISGYRHRERVFEWQLYSSKIIFGVVCLLVGAGICFSWLQFRQSVAQQPSREQGRVYQKTVDAKATERAADAREEGLAATQLEASLKGIRISSSILGVIILMISLLFFYLYLVYIYPIEEIL